MRTIPQSGVTDITHRLRHWNDLWLRQTVFVDDAAAELIHLLKVVFLNVLDQLFVQMEPFSDIPREILAETQARLYIGFSVDVWPTEGRPRLRRTGKIKFKARYTINLDAYDIHNKRKIPVGLRRGNAVFEDVRDATR